MAGTLTRPPAEDTRDPGFRCVVNMSDRSVPLPAGFEVLLASGPLTGALPPDTAVWLADR